MDRFLAIHLRAVAAVAQAQAVALFVPNSAGGLDLIGGGEVGDPSLRLSQAGIDAAELAWKAQRGLLTRGSAVRVGQSMVWPLRSDQRLVGLVYLDSAEPGFPSEHDEAHGQLLAKCILALDRPQGAGARLVREASAEDELCRMLKVALRTMAGNVAAAADLLGIDRDTVYYRAGKYGVDIDAFRPPRTRRRRA